MSAKEFNLSELIIPEDTKTPYACHKAYLKPEDVKEFIEVVFGACCEEATLSGEIGLSQIRTILDKKAGDKLI